MVDFADIAAGVLDDGDLLPAIQDNAEQLGSGVRDYCFRVWMIDAGRNPRRVVEIVKDRASIALDVTTVRRWAISDDWEGRAREVHQNSDQLRQSQVMQTLGVTSVVAAQWFLDALRDPDVTAGVKFKIAAHVLGLVGYVPFPSGASDVHLAVSLERGGFADKTDAELEDIANSYAPGGSIAPPVEVDYHTDIMNHAGRNANPNKSARTPDITPVPRT